METFQTAFAAGHFTDGTLAGLGMSSTELNKPPANWKAMFEEAEKNGITRTAHEEGPAQYIADALDILHVQRIDHARRLAEDRETYRPFPEAYRPFPRAIMAFP